MKNSKLTLRAFCLSAIAMLIMFMTNAHALEQMPTKEPTEKQATASTIKFPDGAATSSETCGGCHVAIYNEFAAGIGSDMKYNRMVLLSPKENPLALPASVPTSASAHAVAGIDPFPMHARETEEEGRSCNVCHFPEAFAIPDIETPEMVKPKPRAKGLEAGGLTCASCHLTPEGKIRGPYDVKAPHETMRDPKMQTAAMCAYCHSMGKRVAGKQTQTFLEWREDFNKPGLGKQHCQDCHMPRTLRKTAEGFDIPVRAVSRHLWTGGHSEQRLRTALNLVIVQPQKGKSDLELHVVNIGAGHSVPTGSNRRAIYLQVRVMDGKGKMVTSKDWMFAPWYGPRPDDKAFLEEDKKRPDATAAMQADSQGPHEEIIRAGEERILPWKPDIEPGNYTVEAKLIYDLNRYNDKSFGEDQTEIYKAALPVVVSGRK
jgi:nitrate/TMAO reductase-like tetraheme cytochrome c subunit